MQRYFKILYWAVLAYLWTVNAASAAPLVGALIGGAGFGSTFGATVLGKFLQTVGGRLLASVAISALQGALVKKPRPAGITTTSTATGGTNPVGFILGDYATAGDAVCPPMTHGTINKTPNAYLTYVIALGDIAGQTLSRVAINGAWVNLWYSGNNYYGADIDGKYAGWAWCKYYDGSQTVADPMLLAKYGSYPERPWLADMIGTGIPYVIMTFRYNREVFPDFPSVMFQCGGIKLYDPRKDSTMGGSGAHRWGQPATYQQSSNPMVQIYNIARGISIAGLGVWGGDIEAADLPTASMFSAMNTCDITMSTTNGFVGSLNPNAQFSAGYEVRVYMEPATVIEELLKGCVGQIAEVGGEFKVRVGGPGLPVMFLTDDDIVVSKAQDFDPFPQADGRQNGIDAKYPDPDLVWQSKSAPSLYNSAWEAEDGNRRVVSLDLPAVPYRYQVQRVMAAYISDERRFRAHNMTLPPDAAILEPLDVISWTSARNSYAGKLFDISQLADDIPTLLQRVSVREVDASDFIFTGSITTIAMPSPVVVVPLAQTLYGWDAQPLIVTDGTGTARKPGIVMTWSATDMDAVDAVEYQVCVKATGSIIKVGAVSEAAAGRIPLSEGIVTGVIYQARGRPVVRGRAAAWTAWVDVTAPAVGISDADFGSAGAYVTLFTNNGLYAIRDVTALPGAGGLVGEKVYNRTDGKFYQWTGSVWKLIVADAADGSITTAKFAAGIAPVEIMATLPATGNYAGRMVFLTSDSKLYRHTGSPTNAAGFTRATDGADISANSIVAGKIAAGAIGATEIAAEQIQAHHLLITPSNMIQNGGFSTGDARGWRQYAGPQAVIPATTAGVAAGAPSANVMQAKATLVGQTIGTFNGENAYTAAGISDFMPMIPGESYAVEIALAASSAAAFSALYVRVYWLKPDGTYTTSSTPITVTALPTSWQKYYGSVVVPAGVVGGWAYVLAEASSAIGSTVWWTNLFVRPMSGGTLTVDGSVSAAKIDTTSFNASGLAVFGGTLQSANYAEVGGIPTAGFQFKQDGTIKGKAIVASEAIIDGAVSRSKLIFGKSVATLSNSAYVVYGNTLSALAGFFQPLVNDGGSAKNPIGFEIAGRVVASGTGTYPAGVLFDIEVQVSGVWASIYNGSFAWSWDVNPVISVGDLSARNFSIKTYLGLDLSLGTPPIETWTGIRLKAKSAASGSGFTGMLCYLLQATVEIRQLNK